MADATPAAGSATATANTGKADDKAQAQAQKRDQEDAAQAEQVQADEVDHGEPSDWAKAQEEARKEAAKDSWGSTPVQMRDQHDPGVDPQTDDADRPVAGPVPSGLEPMETNSQLDDDQKVSGTLPPV